MNTKTLYNSWQWQTPLVPWVQNQMWPNYMDYIYQSSELYWESGRKVLTYQHKTSHDTDGSRHMIQQRPEPFDAKPGILNARCSICAGNWQCPVASNDLPPRHGICGWDSIPIYLKPRSGSLGRCEKGDCLPRNHQRPLADVQWVQKDDPQRVLWCKLSWTATQVLDLWILLPHWHQSCHLELKKTIHCCTVKFWSRVHCADTHHKGGDVFVHVCRGNQLIW